MTYTIKPEYLTLWGDYTTEETIVTDWEVADLAADWGKSVDELLLQLVPVEECFTLVSDRVLRQEGLPARTYYAADAIRTGAVPDEMGTVDLYEMIFDGPEDEDPVEIRKSAYGWSIDQKRII